MLEKVLSKNSCAECRFCCSFRRQSLWELPRLPLEFAERYQAGFDGEPVKYIIEENAGMKYAITDLTGKYLTDDPEEEVRCPFLDPSKGCFLPEADKPFECSMWPLRYMEMPDGGQKISLTPTCPAINRVPLDEMKELARGDAGKKIRKYAETHPYIIKDHVQGFEVLE
ncbi:MAG: hypothetical protein J5829_09705 [Lachnospiraceae bacterium]|nr:hypothetical protein [Lachnospiraceae bacterium]